MRLFCILLLCLPAPPSRAGGALPGTEGDIRAGETAFAEHCQACHGEKAAGGNSPNIQGVTLPELRVALQGIEEMPEFKLDPAVTQQLAAYLMSLAPEEARKRLGQ